MEETYSRRRFVVTPAFVEARKRKFRNDFTTKGVFPETCSKESLGSSEPFVNRSIRDDPLVSFHLSAF